MRARRTCTRFKSPYLTSTCTFLTPLLPLLLPPPIILLTFPLCLHAEILSILLLYPALLGLTPYTLSHSTPITTQPLSANLFSPPFCPSTIPPLFLHYQPPIASRDFLLCLDPRHFLLFPRFPKFEHIFVEFVIEFHLGLRSSIYDSQNHSEYSRQPRESPTRVCARA